MNLINIILVAFCVVAQKTTDKSKKFKTNISTTTVASVTTLAVNLDIDETVTTEETITTTCEANSSCFISTAKPILNDTSAGINITNKSAKEKHSRTDIISTGTDLCTCNLQRNICDINCCCDHDCSLEEKIIFHHCDSENVYYDTRYCDYMKYIYINNTPLQWHVNQNGLFCVLKSNVPPSYIIQRKEALTSFDIAEHEKNGKFSWPQTLEKKEVKFNMSEEFLYGNKIWAIYGNEIKQLQVPKKYFSNTCIMKEDALNLKKMKSICAQIDISQENKHLSFRNYFQNVSIIANPIYLNISKYKNIQECPRNICLAVVPKICDANFNNCQNISRNDSRLDIKCNFEIRNNKNDCKNAVKSVQYNFYHNGTKGFTKVELLGVLENISYEFGAQDFEFFQEFTIDFWWINQTRNFSAVLSGNPGYLLGKPILSGNLVNIGNATNVTLKIERDSNAYLKNFLVLPNNYNGKCVLNNTLYIPIEFGFNLLTNCKLAAEVFNRRKYYNGTEICKEIQKTILRNWGITGKNKTVGMFGNANANIPDEWIKIMYNLSMEKLLNKTTGRFSSANTTLTCFELVNNVIVNIYHSRIDFKTLLNQEKILGVTYSFTRFVNKTLTYSKQKNSTYLELDLESHVVFYDISLQKQKKFVDSPSLEVRLPYDFFYPFIKIDNGAHMWSANTIFHVVVLLITFIVK